MSSDKNSNSITIPQKYLDKILGLQEGNQGELAVLKDTLDKTNQLLERLISVNESGSTVAANKKIVPFHTGSQAVGQLLVPPPNPDDYPTRVDVYSINSNKTIPHMTLINDGPGEIFFINSYSKNVFNEKEGHLNVNDQRELFNVYEIRLRATLPKTTFRLIEGIFRTGSTAPQTKINVEIRPTAQANEVLLSFFITFENQDPIIDITLPTVQTFAADFSVVPSISSPLPPGATATLVDGTTGLPMPFTIPEGFIFESFALFSNLSVDFTIRNYFEFIPGLFSLTTAFPMASRGSGTINEVLNINEFSSQAFDPLGAPAGGRKTLITVTNDDPVNSAIGEIDFAAVLRQIT